MKKNTKTKHAKKRTFKSKAVTLGLLSTMALTWMSCQEEKQPEPTPYDDYNYYGHAGDQGMVYGHSHMGMMDWYLLSRMFNGYGYYPPMYRPFASWRYGVGADGMYNYQRRDDRHPFVGGGGGSFGPHYVSRTTSTEGGFASGAHVSRGGFGANGYHGVGG